VNSFIHILAQSMKHYFISRKIYHGIDNKNQICSIINTRKLLHSHVERKDLNPRQSKFIDDMKSVLKYLQFCLCKAHDFISKPINRIIFYTKHRREINNAHSNISLEKREPIYRFRQGDRRPCYRFDSNDILFVIDTLFELKLFEFIVKMNELIIAVREYDNNHFLDYRDFHFYEACARECHHNN